jgi:hypothetical protein
VVPYLPLPEIGRQGMPRPSSSGAKQETQ